MTGMTPIAEKTWTPEPGRLVMRILTEPSGNERTRALLFHADPTRAARAWHIARVLGGAWEPDSSSHTEGAEGAECMSASGNTVVRRYATDEDLADVVRRFASRHTTLARWVERVCDDSTLADTEKARLRALVPPATVEAT